MRIGVGGGGIVEAKDWVGGSYARSVVYAGIGGSRNGECHDCAQRFGSVATAMLPGEWTLDSVALIVLQDIAKLAEAGVRIMMAGGIIVRVMIGSRSGSVIGANMMARGGTEIPCSSCSRFRSV